jgi:hypothetical protein
MGELEILFQVLIVALDTSVWRLREADSPPHAAAHLFLLGPATAVIRHGGSVAEITKVLRHRSRGNTAI